MHQLSINATLDNYILAKELMKIANLSPNAFRYWKDCIAARYDKSRIVYIHKKYIHKKYKNLANKCTNLDGCIQSAPFCRYTNLPSSHLTKSNNSALYELLDIKTVEGVKFVNLNSFLDKFNLNNSFTIYIEKCRYFAPLEKKIKLTKSLCLGYY
jgi:hypothetical protein